jgi:DNA-binding SARP family transcriptional activator
MIRFRIFGTPELRNGKGTDLYSVLAHSKHTALLAYLLIGGHTSYRREHLTALLWPELDDARARNALSKALHHLRRSLGDSVFIIEGNESVGPNHETIWCDVAEFNAPVSSDHAHAIELYRRGQLLEGFTLSDAPEFEQWLERERARLRLRAMLSATALSAQAEHEGELADAAEWARAASELSPYDEAAHRRLLILLDRTGNRASAVAEYMAFAKLLARDLATEPMLETRSLVESFRAAASAPHGLGERETPASESAERAPTHSAAASGESADASRTIVSRSSLRLFRRRAQPLLLWGAVASTLLAVMILGAMKTTRRHASDDEIVVARFSNQTGDSALDPVGTIVADRLTDGFARKAFRVVFVATALSASRDAEARLTNVAGDSGVATEIGNATGALIVISGSYTTRGDSLDFVAHTTRTTDGRLLGTVHVAEPASDALRAIDGLHERLYQIVRKEISPSPQQAVEPQPAPPNYEAYAEYATGLDLFSEQSWDPAIAHFRRAHALDTGFVTPLFWTVFSYNMSRRDDSGAALADTLARFRNRIAPPARYDYDRQVAMQKRDVWGVVSATKAATTVSPTDWIFDVVLSYGVMNRPRAALDALRQINPDRGPFRNSSSYWIAKVRLQHEEGDIPGEAETVQELSRRFATDNMMRQYQARVFDIQGRGGEVPALLDAMLASGEPRTAERVRAVLMDLKRHGDADLAEDQLPKVLRWHQELGSKPDERSHRWVAFILSDLGHDEEAREEFDSLYKSSHDSTQTSTYAGMLGVLAARRGDSTTAAGFADLISRLPILWPGENTYWRARIAAQLGSKSAAVALLRQSFVEGYFQIDFDHTQWPNFPTLHGYQPFEEIVRSDRPIVKGSQF